MPKVTIWLAYDNDEQTAVSIEGAENAVADYHANCSPPETGMQVISLELELPEIRDIFNNATTDNKDDGDGVALYSIPHPHPTTPFHRVWFWLRSIFWPYDISADSLETVEIEIEDDHGH